MSAKDHKALVKAVATKLCHYPRGPNCFNSCCSTPMGQKRCQNIARAVLALVARTLETVTPEMHAARRCANDFDKAAPAILATLRRSPSQPDATRCHICGNETTLACSDCRINFGASVFVCKNPTCRDEHEIKCFGCGPTRPSSQPDEALAATRIGWIGPDSPNDIRALGWSVAVHNDYRQNGLHHTFWLFTKERTFVKGEGRSDAEALDEVRAALDVLRKAEEETGR